MKSKSTLYVATGVVLLALFFIASAAYKKWQEKHLGWIATESSEVFVREHSPRYGDRNAKVILIEFLDPECESCSALYPGVKTLLSEFENKVQLVVRYAPFHKNSKVAIKALEASRIQKKYWEALEALFLTQPQWGDHHNPRPELIFEFLSAIGLDIPKLKSDMNSTQIEDLIEQDEQDLRTLNVRSTPTFFVNGKMLNDFSIEGLRRLLKSEVESIHR